jgi:2-keto-3-deoxygluconate permease
MITKVPSGLMVVPLFIGMLINTFRSGLLKIGGFTVALSGIGYLIFLGLYLFYCGAK